MRLFTLAAIICCAVCRWLLVCCAVAGFRFSLPEAGLLAMLRVVPLLAVDALLLL